MGPIRVTKDELREVVQTNRDQHQAIFEEAVEGYRKQAVRELEKHIERIKVGTLAQVRVILPLPVNHIRDYDRVLAMLDMSLDDELEIDEHSFQSYVQDDWAWKQEFLTSNAFYSETAAALSAPQ